MEIFALFVRTWNFSSSSWTPMLMEYSVSLPQDSHVRLSKLLSFFLGVNNDLFPMEEDTLGDMNFSRKLVFLLGVKKLPFLLGVDKLVFLSGVERLKFLLGVLDFIGEFFFTGVNSLFVIFNDLGM